MGQRVVCSDVVLGQFEGRFLSISREPGVEFLMLYNGRQRCLVVFFCNSKEDPRFWAAVCNVSGLLFVCVFCFAAVVCL